MKKFRVKSAMRFTANDKIGRSQVKTIEDDEITDERNEDSPFTHEDNIDLVEMVGFSFRQT
jgi:hypothetical protein